MTKIILLFLFPVFLLSMDEIEHRFFFLNDLLIDSNGVPIHAEIKNNEFPTLINSNVPNNDKIKTALTIINTEPDIKERVESIFVSTDIYSSNGRYIEMEYGSIYVVHLLFAINSISDARIEKAEESDVPKFLADKNSIVIKPVGNNIEILSMNKKIPISDNIVIQKNHNKLSISFSKIKGIIF